MPIEREDGAERQDRVDQMIREFREAQARRPVKVNDKVNDADVDSSADVKVPPAGSAIAQ